MPNHRSMRAAFVKVQAILLAAFLLTLPRSSLLGKEKNHVPLPAQVIAAKTVYIDNQSEGASVGDKAREELRKWGRFQLVSDRAGGGFNFRLFDQRIHQLCRKQPTILNGGRGELYIPDYHRWQIRPASVERFSKMGKSLRRLSQCDTRPSKRLEETSRGTNR